MSTRHWVQAELHCLLCGRTLGRLVGAAPAAGSLQSRLARWNPISQFQFFRAADPAEPLLRLTGREHFRCATCGGGVMIDDLESFTTYEDVVDDEPRKGQVGRPPKAFKRLADPRLVELGLAG